MRRLTNKRTWDEAKGDITAEYGYSYIWQRLNAIENILGDDYDLDRLRVLVEAANEDRVRIKPAPYGDNKGLRQIRAENQVTGGSGEVPL